MGQHLRILEVADDVPHTAEAGAAQASLGLRGSWRLMQLVLVLALFAARVWINRRGLILIEAPSSAYRRGTAGVGLTP
jgi:hypothetical protein